MNEQSMGGALWGLFLAVLLGVVCVGCVVAVVYGGAASFEASRAERARADADRIEARMARDRESNIHRETMAIEANAHREAIVAMVLGSHSASENWLGVLAGALAGMVVGSFIVRRWLWLGE